ncbi:MAG: hypothetical protein EOP92_28230 [Lysobacteraceae bacterium]|nr:MAG: hypothetical protein EOP92_28230 [Xanthomonadaceae bacterium]
MNARTRTLPLVLWALVQSACAQVPADTGAYGPVVWPKDRQHLLAGTYAGTLRDHECASMTARLTLDAEHHYLISTACTAPESPARTWRGHWWVDEIAGSCLILDHADGQPKQFGLRLGDDAADLQLDGGDCMAADELDWPHVLKRTGNTKPRLDTMGNN